MSIPMLDVQQAELPWLVVKLGELLDAAISSQWVIYIVVPILVTFGAMCLKSFSRAQRGLKPADWVFGFDLGITASITLLISGFVLLNSATVNTATKLHYVIGLFILLVIFSILLAFSAWAMHKFGWEDSDKEKAKGHMVLIINGVGAALLVTAFTLTGGSFK